MSGIQFGSTRGNYTVEAKIHWGDDNINWVWSIEFAYKGPDGMATKCTIEVPNRLTLLEWRSIAKGLPYLYILHKDVWDTKINVYEQKNDGPPRKQISFAPVGSFGGQQSAEFPHAKVAGLLNAELDKIELHSALTRIKAFCDEEDRKKNISYCVFLEKHFSPN